MPKWDPSIYETYADLRGRPFYELTARVPVEAPSSVVDLGCGTGELTASLGARWPAATVLGVDSSPEMLAKAAAHADEPRISFSAGDIASWNPTQPVDVLVSNAAFQWVPGHLELFPRFVGAVSPGGWFAFSVPGNFGSPSHVLLAELCRSARWAAKLAHTARIGSHEPADYLQTLAELDCRVDCWETTYSQVLQGPDAVLTWTRGTALRPVLEALTGAEQEDFLDEYAAMLRKAYPEQPWGTVFPFRRIFVVAQRGA